MASWHVLTYTKTVFAGSIWIDFTRESAFAGSLVILHLRRAYLNFLREFFIEVYEGELSGLPK